jgi:hypothetical protein
MCKYITIHAEQGSTKCSVKVLKLTSSIYFLASATTISLPPFDQINVINHLAIFMASLVGEVMSSTAMLNCTLPTDLTCVHLAFSKIEGVHQDATIVQ